MPPDQEKCKFASSSVKRQPRLTEARLTGSSECHNHYLKVYSNLGSTGLTPTDVVNAVVDARGGRITSDFLVDDIVIKAANCGVIRPQAAAEVLEEFGFELIFRSDGSYSYTRKAEGKDR